MSQKLVHTNFNNNCC